MLSLQNKWPDTSWTSLKSQKSQTWQQMETKTKLFVVSCDRATAAELTMDSWIAPCVFSSLIHFIIPLTCLKVLYQDCTLMPPGFNVQCFGSFPDCGNPSQIQHMRLRLRPSKTLFFLQIHRPSYGIGAGRRWLVTSMTPSGAREEISL